MPRTQPRIRKVQNSVDTTLVTTAETVVATLGGISTDSPDEVVRLRGSLFLTTGANTTAVTLRIRRDSLTGTAISAAIPINVPAAAGSTDQYVIDAIDTPGNVAGLTYVLTAAMTGASANGTATEAALEATLGV